VETVGIFEGVLLAVETSNVQGGYVGVYWGGAVDAPLRAAGGGVGVLAIGRPCSERTSRSAAIRN
jgi:hypothetical protein